MRPNTFIKLAIFSILPAMFIAAPASAATKEQKMETCKFGAENDKLEGKKRDDFIKKCMANANYEPAARKDALKKKPVAQKPAAAVAPAAAPPAPKQ
jgi:type IV secretory pathway VirB10-like protein